MVSTNYIDVIPENYADLLPSGGVGFSKFKEMEIETFGQIMGAYEKTGSIDVHYQDSHHQLFYLVGETLAEETLGGENLSESDNLTVDEILDKLEDDVPEEIDRILDEDEVGDAMEVMRKWMPVRMGQRVEHTEDGDRNFKGTTYAIDGFED